MYKIWFARNYRTRVANTLLLDNALATMGAGLPSAIAAAILYPNRRVLAVCGDGGFMMNSQELETATRLRVNLVVLILQDNAYGMIRWKQAADGFPDFGMSFGNPDFVTYAKAYGARGSPVESADRLIPGLEAAFDAGGIHLVAVPIDYSENIRVLVDELRAHASNHGGQLWSRSSRLPIARRSFLTWISSFCSSKVIRLPDCVGDSGSPTCR
jgi:acetolactate synthase-1/2/3 large subunit